MKINNNKIASNTAHSKDSAFCEKAENTDIYKKAENFYKTNFVNSENVGELLYDVEENKPSYFELKLDVASHAIDTFIKNHKITKNVFFASAFAYTLSRFTNSDYSYFSMIENKRERYDAEPSIVKHENNLPILIECKNDSVSNYINKCKNIINKTIEYSFYPFSSLKKKYNLSSNVVFQYLLSDKNDNLKLENKKSSLINVKNKKDLITDLSVKVMSSDNCYTATVSSSNRYNKSTLVKLLKTFNQIVKELFVKKQLEDIDYTLKDDINLFEKINNTEAKLKYKDIFDSFNKSLRKDPNKTLVSYKDTKISYSEGSSIIHQITSKINEAKITQNSYIAILVERSHWYLLTALGILNHDSTYVPIDDNFPDERILFMLEDTKATAVLVTDSTLKRCKKITQKLTSPPCIINIGKIKPQQHNTTAKFNKLESNNDKVAFVTYTSGTTGKPKGIKLTYKSIICMSNTYINISGLSSSDACGMYTAFTFDMHSLAFYPSIMKGSSVDIVPNSIRLNMSELCSHFVKKKITHTFLTTHVGKIFADKYPDINLSFLLIAGEKLGKYVSNAKYDIWEAYGTTETFVFNTAIPVNKRIHYSSIGFLNSNSKVYILDKEHRRVPYGAIGEMYLSGYQLSKGYINRQKENKEAFFDNPFDGNKPEYERMYKTGDVVRFLPDGTIGIIGRVDSQVKIRGNRVELGEVEACIKEVADVDDVTVNAIDVSGTKELAAYVVSNNKHIRDLIVSHIRDSKPEYMVPGHFVILDKIPLNENGKVDKKALPNINVNNSMVDYVLPKNTVEKNILNAFKKILNVDQIGVEDDFVALGGNSLQAIQIISLLSDHKIEATDILALKTPRKIAEAELKKHTQTKGHLYKSYNENIPVIGSALRVVEYAHKKPDKFSKTQYSWISYKNKYSKNQVYLALNEVINKCKLLKCKVVNINSNWFFTETSKEIINVIEIDNGVSKSLSFKEIESKYFANNIYLKQQVAIFNIVEIKNSVYLAYCISHCVYDMMSEEIFKSRLNRALKQEKLFQDRGYIEYVNFCLNQKNLDEAMNFYKNMYLSLKRELCAPKPCKRNIRGAFVWKLKYTEDVIKFNPKKYSCTELDFVLGLFVMSLSELCSNNKVYFQYTDNGRYYLPVIDSIGAFFNQSHIALNVKDNLPDNIKLISDIVIKIKKYSTLNNSIPYKKYVKADDTVYSKETEFQYIDHTLANYSIFEKEWWSNNNKAVQYRKLDQANYSDSLIMHKYKNHIYIYVEHNNLLSKDQAFNFGTLFIEELKKHFL